MNPATATYNQSLSSTDQGICDRLAEAIDRALPDADNRIWHAHPVWFLDGNPVVGYGRLKDCVRLLFWSGQSFTTPGLRPEGKFKAAEARYVSDDQIDLTALHGWLRECRETQWDYKNLVQRKGRLDRLK
jgi:hypothetical protein